MLPITDSTDVVRVHRCREVNSGRITMSAGCLVDECGAVDQLLAQVEHRVTKEFVLARVVAIQRGGGDSHPLRDGLHADAVVAERAERLGRRAGDLRLAILRPAPDTRGAGGPGA